MFLFFKIKTLFTTTKCVKKITRANNMQKINSPHNFQRYRLEAKR